MNNDFVLLINFEAEIKNFDTEETVTFDCIQYQSLNYDHITQASDK